MMTNVKNIVIIDDPARHLPDDLERSNLKEKEKKFVKFLLNQPHNTYFKICPGNDVFRVYHITSSTSYLDHFSALDSMSCLGYINHGSFTPSSYSGACIDRINSILHSLEFEDE